MFIVLLACGGCAGTPLPAISNAAQERPMARWTEASTQVFLASTLPAPVVDKARRAIATHADATFHCADAARFSLLKIEPAIANVGLSGPDEIWTTELCGLRKWLVTTGGQAHLLAPDVYPR